MRLGETVCYVPFKLLCKLSMFTCGPGLMQAAFLLELLRQMIESLQTTDLGEEPFLITLLYLL